MNFTIRKEGEVTHCTATFLTINKQTPNGRIYPRSVVKSALRQYMPKVNSKRALGELRMGGLPGINVDLHHVSHMLTNISIVKDAVIGTFKIIKGTRSGDILHTFANSGVSLNFVTRGFGTLEDDNKTVKDFKLTSVDCVVDSSLHEDMQIAPMPALDPTPGPISEMLQARYFYSPYIPLNIINIPTKDVDAYNCKRAKEARESNVRPDFINEYDWDYMSSFEQEYLSR